MEHRVEPEVEDYLWDEQERYFARVTRVIDLLAEQGPQLRMPRSRPVGGGLYELRFNLGERARRITYFFKPGYRVVLLTTFVKQQQVERQEITRARAAMDRCLQEGHTADE